MDPQQAAQRKLVQEMLDRTGFTASELARAAGLAPSTLTRFMNGQVKHALSARTLASLSDASSVPVPFGQARSHEDQAAEAERRANERELAEWIVAERERRRWSREALASLLSVPVDEVERWEAAKARPPFSRIIDMSAAFGVSIASFLAPDAPYHGQIIEAADEMEVLSLWRSLKPEDRGLMLRLLNAALAASPSKPDKPQLGGEQADVG